MGIEAATNCWTSAEDALAQTLPKLPEFRVLVKAADEAAAAKRVFFEETDDPLDGHAARRPEREARGSFAVVTSDQRQPYAIELGRAPDTWFGQGRLIVAFEVLVPEADWHRQEDANTSRGQVYRWTKNRVGTVINELVDDWPANGGPHVRRVTVLGPLENDPETWQDEGRWHLVETTIEWGLPAQ